MPVDLFLQGRQQRRAVACVEKPPASLDRRARISGILRPPVLRLEEIAVAAAGEVERMTLGADERPLPLLQGGAAVADGADQGDQ